MKNSLNKVLIALAVLGTTAQVHAYSYIFSNHTNKEIGLAMRFHGLGEPRYFRWIPKNEARQFTPNQATRTPSEGQVEGRKIGFVAKTFWYVENPAPAFKADRETAKTLPWKEFEITWMPSAAHKLAVKLGEALTDTTMAAGQIAVDAALKLAAAAAAAETGGASLAVQGLITSVDSADKTVIFEALGKLIKATGSVVSRSMVTDRHIDIVETPEGIKFISLL